MVVYLKVLPIIFLLHCGTVNMDGIGTKIQAFLSKSDNAASSPKSESQSAFPWFNSKGADPLVDESGNGWFSNAQKDPLLPSLSKKQRVLGFVGCLLMGTFCMSLAGLYLPFLILKARKFALLYSLGSLFIILSFSLLWGPVNHMKHLFSPPRLPFTTIYFGTMFATLYFALWAKSTLFTVICAVGQILALVWFIVSYIPGGQTGLKFFTKVFYATASKTAEKTLPI